ncbi:hypothetical protein CRUP_032735 [Coryphaenoides rupestris]|nr:hypothetical protein CRUP_032735 [Coryphaenoides rupestris]
MAVRLSGEHAGEDEEEEEEVPDIRVGKPAAAEPSRRPSPITQPGPPYLHPPPPPSPPPPPPPPPPHSHDLAGMRRQLFCSASRRSHDAVRRCRRGNTLRLDAGRQASGWRFSVVSLNDYLDIYCPHYPLEEEEEEFWPRGSREPEVLALYLVAEEDFRGCVESRNAIKRWECNSPRAPFGPVRFSEKIQRFTPFSLGFEFVPGQHYYYSCEYPPWGPALPTDEGPPLPCMKLRVTVCCEPTRRPHFSDASPPHHTTPRVLRSPSWWPRNTTQPSLWKPSF